jgi:hypothetical protein
LYQPGFHVIKYRGVLLQLLESFPIDGSKNRVDKIDLRLAACKELREMRGVLVARSENDMSAVHVRNFNLWVHSEHLHCLVHGSIWRHIHEE